MQCKGKTKKGTRCKKKVEDGFCAAHESQRPEEVVEEVEVKAPCARCGPAKESVQLVSVGPGLEIPLCMSCSIALLRTVLEFTGVADVDGKLLEFRESFSL